MVVFKCLGRFHCRVLMQQTKDSADFMDFRLARFTFMLGPSCFV